jgi:hypothetical protein
MVHLDYVSWVVVMLDYMNRLGVVLNFVKNFLNRVGEDEITVYKDAGFFFWDCPVICVSGYKEPCEGEVGTERAFIKNVARDAVTANCPNTIEKMNLAKLTMLEGKDADFGIGGTSLKN